MVLVQVVYLIRLECASIVCPSITRRVNAALRKPLSNAYTCNAVNAVPQSMFCSCSVESFPLPVDLLMLLQEQESRNGLRT